MSLENVHVGDSVIVTTAFGRSREVSDVDRETKTQLIVGGRKFRRQDGETVAGGGFNSTSISVPRKGEIQAVKEERAVVLFRSLIRIETEAHLKELSAAALRRIHTLLKVEYAAR